MLVYKEYLTHKKKSRTYNLGGKKALLHSQNEILKNRLIIFVKKICNYFKNWFGRCIKFLLYLFKKKKLALKNKKLKKKTILKSEK